MDTKQQTNDMETNLREYDNRIMIAGGATLVTSLSTPFGIGGWIMMVEVLRQAYLKKRYEIDLKQVQHKQNKD